MGECSKCGTQEMTFTCRYCGEKFCSEHRLPENHNCEDIEDVEKKSGSSNNQWFQNKEPKKETIRGTPKTPKKPSLSRDIFETLKNSVTLSIIALTIVTFILQFTVEGFYNMASLSPALSQSAVEAVNQSIGAEILEATVWERPWTLITLIFIHAGMFHIFANMITFYFFGSVLEKKISKREMLAFYFGSGILASIGFIGFRNIMYMLHGPIVDGAVTLGPAVGASGAVIAVFAAVAMIYPDAEVLLYFFIPMKIRTALYLLAGIETAGLLFKIAGITVPVVGNLAVSAHLAGLIVGVIYGYRLRERLSSQLGVLDLLNY